MPAEIKEQKAAKPRRFVVRRGDENETVEADNEADARRAFNDRRGSQYGPKELTVEPA